MIEEVLILIQDSLPNDETIAKAVLCKSGIVISAILANGEFAYHPPYIATDDGKIGYFEMTPEHQKELDEGETVYKDESLSTPESPKPRKDGEDKVSLASFRRHPMTAELFSDKLAEIRGNSAHFHSKTLDLGRSSDTIKLQESNYDGGPGSGNFGHKGVPGQVGGSAPSDGEPPRKSSENRRHRA
jgi:hypothetical protein